MKAISCNGFWGNANLASKEKWGQSKLSLLSILVQQIFQAKQNESEYIVLMNTEIPLRQSVFFFVSTYKIQLLPEFFKFSFRHVSFIQPDTEMILESLLLSFGF